ncbi:hypothetical protein Ancab_014566 [Ancistrocladus abbreviatus]
MAVVISSAAVEHLNSVLSSPRAHFIRLKKHLKIVTSSSSLNLLLLSRNYRSNFDFNFNLYSYKFNVLHVRAFSSISPIPLPSLPHSTHPLRSRSDCVSFLRPSLLPLCRTRFPDLRLVLMSQTDGPTAPQDSSKTVRCVIKGRVQGVFYRNWTVENATELGLKGWVRNRRDGSVEALFSGKPKAVDEMQQRCRRGPPDAIVTGFEAFPSNDDPGTGFARKPTA